MSVLAPLTSRPAIRIYLWVLHVLVVLLLVAVLWFVNHRYRLGEQLLSPFPSLHGIWLPLLFLLLYLGGWLAWWFFRTLSDRVTGKYPDIDAAWAEVRRQLDVAGIDLGIVPVFLVLGKPRSGVADFFAASNLSFAVRHDAEPVGVYATRQAIYLVAGGASTLSWYSDRLHAATAPGPPGVSLLMPDEPPVVDLTVGTELALVAPAPAATSDQAVKWLRTPSANRTDLPADRLAECADRLTHLCQLLAAARCPRCPANGVVWLVPAAGTDADPLADATAEACRADLGALEAGLQLDCPMSVVLADSQAFAGFRELLASLPAAARNERMFGCSLPLVPNLPPTDRFPMVTSAMEWVTTKLVPALVYQRLGEAPEPLVAAKLWRVTDALYARRHAITRIVCQGLMARAARPPMVAGVYLAATGPDAADRGFAAAVLAELQLSQNLVSWTEAAVADEADSRRTAAIGYTFVVLFAVALITFGWWTWYR